MPLPAAPRATWRASARTTAAASSLLPRLLLLPLLGAPAALALWPHAAHAQSAGGASGAATAPSAQQLADAEALLRRGIEARQRADDAGALALFEQARAIAPTPRVLAQIALAEQALGRWADAEAHLSQAMAAASDPWIAQNRAVLQQSLGVIGQHLGSLDVVGTPAGAEVLIDGTRAGTLPLAHPLRVRAGEVTLVVRAPGYFSVSRAVAVPAGGASREPVTLTPREDEPATPSPRGASALPAPVPPQRDAPTPPPASSVPPLRIAGWAALGGAAALGIFGGVAQGVREDNIVRFNDDANCLPLDGRTRGETCGHLLAAGNAWGGVAIGAFIGAGALAVTGLALLLVPTARANPPRRAAASPRHRERARGLAVACGRGPGELGLACGGAF